MQICEGCLRTLTDKATMFKSVFPHHLPILSHLFWFSPPSYHRSYFQTETFHAQGRWIGPTIATHGLVKKAFGLFSKVAQNFNFCVKGVLAPAEAERSLEFTWALHMESGEPRAVQYQRQGWEVIYQKLRCAVHLYILAMYDCKKVPGYWMQPTFQTNISNTALPKAPYVLRTAWKRWEGSVRASVDCMANIQKRHVLGHSSKDWTVL